MSRYHVFLILGVLTLPIQIWAQDNPLTPTPSSPILIESIVNDIRELSHPRYEGRQAGTRGGLQSASYLKNRFRSLGLQPGSRALIPDGGFTWFHQQPLTAIQLAKPATVTLSMLDSNRSPQTVVLVPGQDFLPALDSPASKITGRVVFVGYGIVDPARGVDDYRGIDVRNRVVLFLRGRPPTYKSWVTHEEKAVIAKERGAAGFLTATGPLLDPYETRKGFGQIPLAIYSGSPDDRPIPGAWIDGKALDRVLESVGISLESLQRTADDTGKFFSRSLPLLAHLRWENLSLPGMMTNVIGMLPGHDPQLRDEIVLIGAHRDHFGEQAGLLFPGGDDNASGTAVLIELARIFSQRADELKRTLLFVSFDGEERGLLGSTLYVNHPTFSLERTVTMINLDHLGVGNGKLTIGVTRKEKILIQLAAEQAGLAEQVQIYGYFPGGDHVPFYEAGVPTITVVSSGRHPHFHQPSDTSEFIQSAVLITSTKFLLSLISLLADQPPP